MKEIKNKSEFENYAYISNSLNLDEESIRILEQWDNFGEIMKRPRENYHELRKMSLALYNTNGIYTQMVNYMAWLYTFDYIIYPNHKTEIDDKEKIKANFRLSAEWLDKFDIKETCPQILRDIFIEGTAFYYEVETKIKANLRKIPSEYCKISYVEDGVSRYSVNLSMLNSSNIALFTDEIKKAYLEYVNGTNKESWYLVSKKGVAFSTDSEYSNGLPLFVFLIPNMKDLEKAKKLSDVKDVVDNQRIVIQKIPLDPRTNKALFPPSLAEKFHTATKNNLPDGVAITTNPLDVKVESFGNSYNQANDIMDRATREVWNNSGVSNQLFNNSNNSAEALRKNVIVNQILIKRFLGYFTIYLNSKISRRWKYSMAFMPITEMNKAEMVKLYSSSLATGGSRLQALSAYGLEPLQALNVLELEQNILDIDTLMMPKASGYNISSQEVGRPTNEDKGIADSESAEDSKNRGDF